MGNNDCRKKRSRHFLVNPIADDLIMLFVKLFFIRRKCYFLIL
jgi:hypothetical protein